MNALATIDNGGVTCVAMSHCVACGSAGGVLHEGLFDVEFGASGIWSQRRCSNAGCGLAWLDPHPLRDQVGKFYEGYFTHSGATTIDGAPVIHSFDSSGTKKRVKQALAALLPWRRRAFESDRFYLQGLPPGRLLDIGCGNGDFIGMMAHAGWDAHGLDFDEAAIAVAKRFPGVTTAVGDVFSQAFAAESFDAILMSNVIEHVPDPVETFAECRRILKVGGRLVMITPNLASLGHALFGADWRGLEPPRHLFLFDATSLRRLARGAGFTQMDLFTSPGDAASNAYVVERSQANARAAGRTPPAVVPKDLIRRERLLDIAGRLCGEWVILVAHR